MSDEIFLGYNRMHEDVEQLHGRAVPFVKPAGVYSAPESISIRSWSKIRYQGRKGACTGFARAACGEISNYYDTNGGIISLSPDWAYYTGQKHCGLLGKDQGATIMGSLAGAKEDGECLESTMAYSEVYQPRFSDAAKLEGSQHLIQRWSILKSIQEMFDWLATGQGSILIGIPWTRTLHSFKGKKPLRDIGSGSLGGHALCVCGYFLDENGEIVFEVKNSHGVDYGDEGYLLLHERAMKQLLNGDWIEAVGISDIQEWKTTVVRRVVFDVWPEMPA